MKNICIVGAGAIGGWLAAGFARAGCSVSAYARGDTLAALRSQGLRIEREGRLETFPIRAASQAQELGPQDLVVVAVKAPALAAVAPAVAALLGPQTAVLTAMNGVPWWFLDGFGGAHAGTPLRSVDADGSVARAIPAAQVVGGVVHCSCALAGPAHVLHKMGNRIILGEPSGGTTARLQALATALRAGGIEADVSTEIQKDIWFKLWGNMTVNPVSAITGATTDLILDDELVRGFISAIMLEARDIGARIGIPIAQQPEDRHAVTRKLGPFKTSMLQDVEAGRPVELDALVGAVRELGLITGVPTPQTDTLYGLARLHARQRHLY